MTNREKYHFDDFTLTNYRRLVQLAVDKGFQFILHKDEYVPERKDVIWRHDVEFEPDIALKMALIEAEVGVKATYFFQLHSPFYNVAEPHYREVLYQIKDLGHCVGLHFDSAYWGITDESQLNVFITHDKDYLQTSLGVEIDTFSFHNTTKFTQSCLDYKYGGLINVYSSFFKEHYNYCGDSLGYWRFDRLEDVLKNEHGHDEASKLLLAQSEVVEGLVDDGGGRHGEHTAEEDAVHLAPLEALAHEDAEHRHTEDDGDGGDNGRSPHLQDFLEREVESQREEQEHDADVGPEVYVLLIDHGGGVGHVGRYQEAGHDVAQDERLLEFLEYEGDDACYDEHQGKVFDKWGKF